MCNGNGTHSRGGNCTNCQGEGFVSKRYSIAVRLTMKNLTDRNVSYPGMGDKLANYPENGDLIFRLRYRRNGSGSWIGAPKGIFRTRNDEYSITYTISLTESLLGLDKNYILESGESVPVKIDGPIQPGYKHDFDGLQVTFVVKIPNILSGGGGINDDIKRWLEQLDKQQEKDVNEANKAAKKQVDKWCSLL